jgi:translation initiation factor 4G
VLRVYAGPSLIREGYNTNHLSQASSTTPTHCLAVPLQLAAGRWIAPTRQCGTGSSETNLPEIVGQKVEELLNKLTMERFDYISDQIIGWANKFEKENDGQTLIQVIRLVFEKATDEATFPDMYARLCRKMIKQISTKVSEDSVLDANSKLFSGGRLFRKYLLDRYQEDVERGWIQQEANTTTAAVKVIEDKMIKIVAEKQAQD